ncbi:toprim domain-containing protein [Mycoplasmopsis primatum]|uniref:toprim domain-containing protein n=1 Tax=Mycoplasmopsis primatum TaxID=55604 RepID=UPI00049680A6|nr:toprim domain-containing protein [Mycoplasmopsis primatum]
MKIKTIDELTKTLSSIPSITKKQAEKLANYLLTVSDQKIVAIIDQIKEAKSKLKSCQKCNFIEENGKCVNCDRADLWNILMVVENVQSVKKIYDLDFFNGYFYVLPYLMSMKPKDQNADFNYSHLLTFAKNKNIKEAIIVLSPTLEGELTTTQLIQIFDENKIKSTRAAIGLPINSNIEYIDGFTIKQAIENRTK